MRTLLARTIVASLCATAVAAIGALLAGSLDGTSGRVLLTTLAVSIYGLLGVPTSVLLERDLAPWLGRASAAVTVVSFLFTAVAIWGGDHDRVFWQSWGIAGTLALALAQAAVVEARRRDTDSPAIARLAGISMLTGALLALLGVLEILRALRGDASYRLLGVVGVLDLLVLATITVLRRAGGPIDRTHRIRIDGRLVETPGRDFASAVAAAIRAAEREGASVHRIERA